MVKGLQELRHNIAFFTLERFAEVDSRLLREEVIHGLNFPIMVVISEERAEACIRTRHYVPFAEVLTEIPHRIQGRTTVVVTASYCDDALDLIIFHERQNKKRLKKNKGKGRRKRPRSTSNGISQ